MLDTVEDCTMAYCSACGKLIDKPQARFCGSCGAAVQTTPQPNRAGETGTVPVESSMPSNASQGSSRAGLPGATSQPRAATARSMDRRRTMFDFRVFGVVAVVVVVALGAGWWLGFRSSGADLHHVDQSTDSGRAVQPPPSDTASAPTPDPPAASSLPSPPAPLAVPTPPAHVESPRGAVVQPSTTPTVRVGGNIKPPLQTVHVAPIYPSIAQSARVQGVVIIEATIGPDGSVKHAEVLRSIPLLDQAAIDAVKQWKYEPTLVDGVPVKVIMTVTVNFTLQ